MFIRGRYPISSEIASLCGQWTEPFNLPSPHAIIVCCVLQDLGVMTDAEFEKVAEIQAQLTDIQIRHQFVTNDREVNEMKLDARA